MLLYTVFVSTSPTQKLSQVLDPTMLEVDLPLDRDSWNLPMAELIEHAGAEPGVEIMDGQRQISVMCKMAMLSKPKEPLIHLNRLDPMLGEAIGHWCIRGADDKMTLIAEWKTLVLEHLKSLF